MSTRTEDQDFLAYRDQGSIEGLARVFDALAPRLLLLAAHVTPDAAQAEDLVQATFLEAMRGAERYDGVRPVAGWLSGILKHRAQDLRRRAAVRRSDPLPGELPGELSASDDPLQVLQDQELWERVAAEVDALPNPYREVLSLRLVHGLEPTAIAHTLGRNPNTVRMQLKRGLERLRQAMPTQMAGLAPWILEPVRGLESIKSVVLSQAGGAAATAATFSSTSAPAGVGWFAGALMMKAWVWVLIGTLSMVAFWTLMWFDQPISEAGLEPTRSERRADLQAAQEDAPPLSSVEVRASGSVAKETDVSEPEPNLAPEGLTVAVRYESDDSPAADVGVYLRSMRSEALGQERRTDAAGFAHFEVVERGWNRIDVDRLANPVPILWEGQPNMDVTIPPGIEVVGHVVTLDEQAVPGATIYRVNERHHDVMQRLTVCDAQGRFHLRDVSQGTELLARARGWQPSETHRAAMGFSMELQMGARGQTLRGSVVDEHGQRVPHAWLVVGVDEDARESLEGSTEVPSDQRSMKAMDLEGILVRADERGSFETHEVPAGFVLVIAREPDFDGERVGHTHFWMPLGGEWETVLAMQKGALVHGVVRDRSAKPVAGVQVEVEWEGSHVLGQLEDELGPFVSDRKVWTAEDGSYRLPGLVPGDYDLRVRGGRRTLLQLETELTRAQTFRWDPVVDEVTNLEVDLRSFDGQPLVGWFVEVRGATDVHLDWNLIDRTTHEDGRTRVLDLRPEETYRLRVFGPNDQGLYTSLAAAQRADIRGDLGSVTVTLTADEQNFATVRGRCLNAQARPGKPGPLRLLSLNEAGQALGSVQADGSFVFEGIPAGRYRLKESATGRMLLEFEVAPGEERDLGSLTTSR